MFKKIKELLTPVKNDLKQRGQLVILYALMIPMLFLFVGTTFDLSWYYINVSRMQNAADAAVIAGAQTLINENGNLSYCMGKTFINSYDGNNTYEFSRDTTLGDNIAKTYVMKNLANDNSNWDDDTIVDLWTRNELRFESTLQGDQRDNFETLYYQVMLEEDVPHMFLNGLFDNMNAKVSSVVQINQFLKGYDLFEQMKLLGNKRTYSGYDEVYDKILAGKNNNLEAIEAADSAAHERCILPQNIIFETDNNRRVELLNFSNSNAIKQSLDNLIIGFNPNSPTSSDVIDTGDVIKRNYRPHRVINIDTVYPVRDYYFYMNNPAVLEKVRVENSSYNELTDADLSAALAKDSPDPVYIRIESEPDGKNDYAGIGEKSESVRQIIINVLVDNTDEMSARPIVLFYDGPESRESLPVILNLNADFRGVLYAPNSSVAINGNGHEFQGFIVADSFVKLAAENEDDEYTEVEGTDTEGNVIYTFLIDNYGYVQYETLTNGNYDYVPTNSQGLVDKSEFEISEADFDSLNLIKIESLPFLTSNIFTTEGAKAIK